MVYQGIYREEMLKNYDFNWHMASDSKNINNPDFQHFFIMEDTAIIGYLIFSERKPPVYKDFTVCLNSLYILPQYQKKGIGRKAFAMVESFCREKGAVKFYNQCHPLNRNALKFYEKMGGKVGFQDIGHDNKEEDCVWFEYDCQTAG